MTSPHDSNTPAPPQSVHPAADDLGFDLPEPSTMSRGRLATVSIVAVAVLGAAFLFGYLPKHRAQSALVVDSHADNAVAPFVQVCAQDKSVTPHCVITQITIIPQDTEEDRSKPARSTGATAVDKSRPGVGPAAVAISSTGVLPPPHACRSARPNT